MEKNKEKKETNTEKFAGGVKVITKNIRYFSNQVDAKNYAIKLLEAGLLFLIIEKVEE